MADILVINIRWKRKVSETKIIESWAAIISKVIILLLKMFLSCTICKSTLHINQIKWLSLFNWYHNYLFSPLGKKLVIENPVTASAILSELDKLVWCRWINIPAHSSLTSYLDRTASWNHQQLLFHSSFYYASSLFVVKLNQNLD